MNTQAEGGAARAVRGAVPLYHQIFLTLRDEIMSGRRPFGALVPTEQELSAMFAVSRITARRALDELAQHRLVERKRRVGTRVVFKTPTKPLEADIEQAIDSLVAFGRNTKVRVLEIAEEPASGEVAEGLQLEPGAPVLRAARMRLLDGEPLGHIVSYVPSKLGAIMTRKKLASTPILALLQNTGLSIGAARQTIAAVVADTTLAPLLSIEPRAPVLRITRVVADTNGEPILLTIAQYRADRYQIRLDLQSMTRMSMGLDEGR